MRRRRRRRAAPSFLAVALLVFMNHAIVAEAFVLRHQRPTTSSNGPPPSAAEAAASFRSTSRWLGHRRLSALSESGGDDEHHEPHAPPPPLHLQPQHLAIIPDGNGRWAQRRGLPRAAGHREGAKRAFEVLQACQKLGGVKLVTLYCLSTENWARPPGELTVILGCVEAELRAHLAYAHAHGIRIAVVGQRHRLPASLQRLIARVEAETGHYEGLTVCLALGYGGRADIVQAARQLAAEAASGALRPEEVDEAAFARRLQTGPLFVSGFGDPDLIVRTSGERRLSNFLLFEGAYAELFVAEALWPDFGPEQLRTAVWDYARRRRRYGGLEGKEEGEEEEEGTVQRAAAQPQGL